MYFEKLKKLIINESQNNSRTFDESSKYIEKTIFDLTKKEIVPLLKNIGIIPESIAHDSSEEKLFAKTADILLAKTFQEIGFLSSVNKERANCADVMAKSKKHKYTLIGDAKAFRLSRTAKNQKDFKVKSMEDWRGDNDFSVLVCPFYQYPKSKSQIYGQALNGNICLLGWEHLVIFIENNVEETENFSLDKVWDISNLLSAEVKIKDKNENNNFHQTGNKIIQNHIKVDEEIFNNVFKECRDTTINRSKSEIEFWRNKIEEIKRYTKKKLLLNSLKR